MDDNPAKLSALAAIVSNMNLDVVTASSGVEALRRVLEQDFAVILLDVRMPTMDGYEAANIIHSRPRSALTPIIYITAEALTEVECFRGYTAGAVDWLVTPIIPRILRAKVQVFADIFTLQRQLLRQIGELHLAHTAFNIVEDAVLVTDRDNRIIKVNPAFTTLTGYSADEVVGKDPRILASGQHPPEFYRALWETLNATNSWNGEMWERRKNGEIYIKWLSIKRVLDDKGSLTNYVASFSDISKRKADADRMEYLAYYDALTGLPNKMLFTDRLGQALAQANRDQVPVTLMFVDLDKFKSVNDNLGHGIGDQVLKEVALHLRDHMRESDTASRISGDKFVVLLAAIGVAQNALVVAEKIRQAICQPFKVAGHRISITSSIGVAIYPEHGSAGDLLLKNADIALYHAKQGGRNNVKLYQPDMVK